MRGRRFLYLAGGLGLCLLGMAGLDRLFPPDLSRLDKPGILLFAEGGDVLSALSAGDGRLRFTPRLEELDPFYLRLLVAVEDQRFWHHVGVDPLAGMRAVAQAVGRGRVVSGASTLTMQTARLLNPRPRTLFAKVAEGIRALQLEAHKSKAQILTTYLTLAPYGGRVEGIEAAARVWFGKSPRHLTPAESALLVALPQSPETVRPDRFPDAARKARQRILSRAVEAGLMTPQAAREAGDEPLPRAFHPLPTDARHLAERLRRNSAQGRLGAVRSTPEGRYSTTLNAGLMRALPPLLSRALVGLDPEVTAAALVVESATGTVRAYVGSSDYHDQRRRGMVDMIPVLRSPGSTLKPFIYALAFEGLIVHPDTLITDSPRRFRDYAPGNFDNTFHGDMTVAEALRRSLNLPAVALLERVGPLVFDARLRQAGVPLTFDRAGGAASLPIALGGVGVSLESLTRLYGALGAGEGRIAARLRFLIDDAPAGKEDVQTRAFLRDTDARTIRRILQGTPRPPGFQADGVRVSVAFKTGTSYGQRDAWAMGIVGPFTVGVWVGRADGKPCAGCIGIKAAAPVMMQIANLLPSSGTSETGSLPQVRGPVPPSLRRFSLKPSTGEGSEAQSGSPAHLPLLTLRFPVEGSVVELSPDGVQRPLPLTSDGGVRPLTWFVNGARVPSDPLSDDAIWPTPTLGFVHVTVVDALGRSAHAEAFLRRD